MSVLINTYVVAQESIVFEKTYRTVTDDTVIIALTGAQTSDGGYLLGGYAAYGMYLSQMMFFKIDSIGNYQWKKMYGSLPCSSNMIHDMEPVGDGTFICCGEGTFSNAGDLKPNNTMIMRVDENANIIWHKEFDTGGQERLLELALSDTGYICVGATYIYDKYSDRLFWITGDFNGVYSNTNILDYGYWSQFFRGVTKMPDGNFVIAGHNWDYSFLFKVNPIGDTLKTIVLGNEYPEQICVNDVEFTNKLVFCGTYTKDSYSTVYYTAFFATCDNNFENIDTIFYEPENEVRYSYSQKIVTSKDNSFLIIGSMRTVDRGVDFWLKKHNSNGELLWKRYVGGKDLEYLRDVIKTNDNGYLIIGDSGSFNQYVSMYIVKTDSLGLGNYTSPVENYIANINKFLIYPNPAKDIVCIEFENKNSDYTIEIYDMSGRLVTQKHNCNYQNFLNIENLTNGLYIVKIIYENYSYQNKLIINH